MYQSTTLFFETLKSLDSATLSGSYLPIGTALTHEARILKIINNSTVAITISTDGSTDMDFLPIGSFVLYDAGTNRGNASQSMAFPKGTQFYAKGSVGTGSVYLTVLYGNTPTQTIPQ